jgi:hypothetical protein
MDLDLDFPIEAVLSGLSLIPYYVPPYDLPFINFHSLFSSDVGGDEALAGMLPHTKLYPSP